MAKNILLVTPPTPYTAKIQTEWIAQWLDDDDDDGVDVNDDKCEHDDDEMIVIWVGDD